MKELPERTVQLAKLAEHEAWPALRELVEARKQTHLKRIADQVLRREDAVITQREIDYTAGFWDGCEWLLANPTRADAAVERFLRKEQAAETLKEE